MAPSKIIGSTSKSGYSSLSSTAIDWLQTGINGGSLLLAVVSDAANIAPIPYLQQAAGMTIKIALAIQAVKDNKMAFRRIAHQSMELVAAIYHAYERSPNKEQWPPREINVVIEELLNTLQLIFDLVEKQLSRAKIKRFFSSTTDLQIIAEYRERLQGSVNKFEVSSHLSIHDTLSQIVRFQIESQERLEREKMAQAERERMDFHNRRLQEEERIRANEEARRAQQEEDERMRFLAAQHEQHEQRERERAEEAQTQDAIMRIHYVTDVQMGERERKAAENAEREREIQERELERERMAREDEERLARLQEEERAKADLVRRLKEEAEVEKRRMEAELREMLERERKQREDLEREAALELERLHEELEKAKLQNRKTKGKGKQKSTAVEGAGTGVGRASASLHQPAQHSVLMEASVGRYSVKMKKRQSRPVNKTPRVETEDEDEEEESSPDEDEPRSSESSSDEESPPTPPPPPPPPPKKKKKKAKDTPTQPQTPELAVRQQLLALGIDLNSIQGQSQGNNVTAAAGVNVDALGAAYARLSVNSNAAQMASQPPPPPPPPTNFYSPYPNGGIAYAPAQSPPPPAQSPYPAATPSPTPPPGMYPQYYGGLIPTSPPGYYMAPVGYPYAQPGGYNTGNVTNTTISNVGNDYSISGAYDPPPKKKKKSGRD